jgi:catechol 2,3-dioxygenase-like lactoylglutathione lyase family enzyme
MWIKMRWMGILVLLGACSITAKAQPPAAGAGIIGIAHLAFRVSDLDREIAFLGKLGYEEAFSMTDSGRTTEVFIKVNDHQFIELYPQTSPSQPLGWMHVCFEVGDLNALYGFYKSTGLNLNPVQKAAAGNLISHVDDPEHRVTEFTQYMPGSRHTLDQGQHLGEGRVSTQLLGFDLPVRDGAAMKEFYTDLGFEPEDANGNVRLSAPSASDLHIELRALNADAVPEFLFAVPDARKAAAELKHAGLKSKQFTGLVFINDPDGNIFVFLETGK